MDPTGSSNRDNWPGEVLAASGRCRLGCDGAGPTRGRRLGVVQPQMPSRPSLGPTTSRRVVLGAQEEGFGAFILIGASNGTTSVLDYAALSATEAWPAPDGFVMLSAVGSTTNNHEISDMPALPAWFGFPSSEADNNASWQDANPGGLELYRVRPRGPRHAHVWGGARCGRGAERLGDLPGVGPTLGSRSHSRPSLLWDGQPPRSSSRSWGRCPGSSPGRGSTCRRTPRRRARRA